MKEFEKIVWPENFTEDQKRYFTSYFKYCELNKLRICVIYLTDCCGCIMDFILDRFPMSEKILTVCPVCNKGCRAEIKKPEEFYLPLMDQTFHLKDLKNMEIIEGPQFEYLSSYKLIAEIFTQESDNATT